MKVGPDLVEGTEGVGYRFTTGTTGGAAYAIAIGSKPRRDAMVSLITYRDGRPVGIQPVTLQTNGTFVVEEYVELELDDELEEELTRYSSSPVAGVGAATASSGFVASTVSM